MGKGKGTINHESSSDAYQRVNFLYQASLGLMQENSSNALPAYFAHLARQIAKKVVGKIHPDMKRSLCKACSNPLTNAPHGGVAKVLPFRKKKKKCGKIRDKRVSRELSISLESTVKLSENENMESEIFNSEINEIIGNDAMIVDNSLIDDSRVNRIKEKTSRPNKIKWSCRRCGFEKETLQRPGYKLWLDKDEAVK